MTAPALTFLAPPSTGADPDDLAADLAADLALPTTARRKGRRGANAGTPAGGLRMTRGAREAAAGRKVADADIRRCLDAPDDVSPDPNNSSRTRFRRGNLVVVAAADGMVLRVNRRGK